MRSSLQIERRTFSTRSDEGRIERRYRLVGEDHLRLLSQRTRDADALLLATREAVAARQRFFEKAHACQAIKGQPSFLFRKANQSAPE